MLTIAGAGDMVSGIFRQSILQTAVQDAYRGRLDGIGMAVWATGPSIGNVESGVVASVFSVQTYALRRFAPGFWSYDAKHPTP
jgi:hypothetical protein